MDFLIRPFSFLFIIFFTYFLKRVGIFKKELSLVVLKIIMNCTLPAVVISAFGNFERDWAYCWLVLLGLAGALGPYLIMYVLTKKQDKGTRVYYMISASGFNIGCYGMPIITAFFGPVAAVVSAFFDIGNSIMMTSGNYAFTSILLNTDGDNAKIRISDLLKRFFSSVPIDVYLAMFVISMLGVRIPQPVIDFISPLSSANAFLAMFMLGLLFTPPKKKADWKGTIYVLAFRFAILVSVAVLMFYILPFSLEVRRIVVLLLLCPMGAMAPAFIEKCHGDGELAAFTNSISTIASLIIMTILAGYFQMN